MTRGPFDDTAWIDAGPIQAAEATLIEARFAVTAWFGFHTRHWWALDEGRLVEGNTPDRLGEQIMAGRRAAARRWTG